MYFKPRIFISSTLKILSVRSEIEQFLMEVGAEVMLYERNLTPSVNTATYRKDILDAGFVIFILHDSYSTKTNTGKSGTHEEWDIALQAKIPKHVYIQKDKKYSNNRNLKSFIKKEKITFLLLLSG